MRGGFLCQKGTLLGCYRAVFSPHSLIDSSRPRPHRMIPLPVPLHVVRLLQYLMQRLETSMKHTLGQAAKECGVSKSTLSRWIQKGRISAEPQEDGSFLIDASELNRIKELHQQSVARNGHGTPPLQQSGTPSATPASQLEIDLMREQIQVLRQEREQDRRQHERTIEDLRQDRDAWRVQAEKQTLLLTHAQQPPVQKATLWQRLFG
jgi:Helix-turn-helix domain